MKRWKRVRATALLLALATLAACAPGPGRPDASGSFTVIAVNDIYRIEGVKNGAAGGLARVRSLRKQLEARGEEVLVLHAGDALFPSLLSRVYKGAQMIDILNGLDGDNEAFDPRFFITFGNHEFDRARAKHAPELRQRLQDSQFTWLNANVHFAQDSAGQSLMAAPNHVATQIVEAGGIKVGIFGLTSDVKIPEYVTGIENPVAAARRASGELRAAGAEVVIALSHLDMGQDVKLIEALGDDGPDLIFGGHEHFNQVRNIGGVPRIFKADADAVTAFVVQVHAEADGVTTRHRLARLDGSLAPDPALAERTGGWLERFDREYCQKRKRPPGCLQQVVGHTRVALEAEELRIRSTESNLGSWLADQALAAFAGSGAQVAFLNAGSLRLNYDLPPGNITHQQIAELFAYPAPLYLIQIDGRTLKQVAQRAVSEYPGQGRWLQIAGFAFRHNVNTGEAGALTLLTDSGPRAVRDEEPILAVTGNFLLDPSIGDQDGYTMLGKHQVVDPRTPPDLRDRMLAALRTAGEKGIAPVVRGRICEEPATGPAPCLALPR
ncbi:MAG: bifunctional metallophosphatase/5'-nucleotidase [Gammaproteobacteria bacterium]|nr:bifunctional metallophosphatase/5'-nucleotidase [Gammaproteobacteria bacterium]